MGFACTTARHRDVGAQTPGSAGIVEAIDLYAEGLQFKAIKIREAGRDIPQVWRILRDNVRAPNLVVGDMEAQIAACEIGAARFGELIDQHGAGRVTAAADALMDHSETMMRRAISALPDGVCKAATQLDGFLDDPERRHLTMAVTLTVRGDEIEVDLDGASPQIDDRPVNMPFVGTTDIAIWLTLRSVLLDSAVHGIIPQNSGLTRPITIKAPKGCLANPNFPAPVIARFTRGNPLADTVMKARSQCAPEMVSAGIGALKVSAFAGLSGGERWVHMEIFEGAYGGRLGMDGMDAVDTLYADTRKNPVEDIETHLSLRVTRYELNEDVAGAGKWRGGFGSIRAFEFLADGGASVEGEGHAFRPWGSRARATRGPPAGDAARGRRRGAPDGGVPRAAPDHLLPPRVDRGRSGAGRLLRDRDAGEGDPRPVRGGRASRRRVLSGLCGTRGRGRREAALQHVDPRGPDGADRRQVSEGSSAGTCGSSPRPRLPGAWRRSNSGQGTSAFRCGGAWAPIRACASATTAAGPRPTV